MDALVSNHGLSPLFLHTATGDIVLPFCRCVVSVRRDAAMAVCPGCGMAIYEGTMALLDRAIAESAPSAEAG